MNYTIKRFYPATGQLIVEFDPSLGEHCLDIPLTPEGLFIVGEQLEAYIQGFAPVDFIAHRVKIAAGIPNAAEIAALAPEVEVPPTAEQLAARAQQAKQEELARLEPLVLSILAKHGVIAG